MPYLQNLILIAIINFTAAFIQGACGFGYALVAMSSMPLFFPMSECAAISAVTVVTIGFQMTLTLRRYLHIETILLPLICSISAINLGLYLLNTLNELILRTVLACLLFLVTALFLILRKHSVALPNRWPFAVGAGLLTGISTGMFNIVGPFLLVYYMSVCKDTMHLKASLEFSFLIAGLYSTAMHIFVYKNITPYLAPQITISAAAALAAGICGLRIYRKINRDKIAIVVYILLPVMAVLLVWNGLC